MDRQTNEKQQHFMSHFYGEVYNTASVSSYYEKNTVHGVCSWRRGVVVTALVVSTKLFYVEPG